MTKSALRKIIRNNLDHLLASKGFLFHPRDFCYYRIQSDVVSFVLFSDKSYGYECGLYVQPLYVPNSSLVLCLGDSIEHAEFSQRQQYYLWKDYAQADIETNISNISLYLSRYGFSWLQDIGTPAGISQNVLGQNEIGRRIFSPIIWRIEAKAYSDLYLGNYKDAQRSFEEFLSILKKDYIGEWVTEQEQYILDLLMIMNQSPEKIDDVLRMNVCGMREKLKI